MLVKTDAELGEAHWSLIRACVVKWDPVHAQEYTECALVHGMLGLGTTTGLAVPRVIRSQRTLQTTKPPPRARTLSAAPFRTAEGCEASDDIPCIQCGGRGGRRVCGAAGGELFAHVRCGVCVASSACVLCAYADTVMKPGGDPFNTPVLQAVYSLAAAAGPGAHVLIMAKQVLVRAMIARMFVGRGCAVWRYEPDLDKAGPEDEDAKCLEWTQTRKQSVDKGPAVLLAPLRPGMPPGVLSKMSQVIAVAPVGRRPPACVFALLRQLKRVGRPGVVVTWISVPDFHVPAATV
jgi:hypothetical protein